MKIGEVARSAGVSIDTVRFYERRGVLPEPERLPSGYRVYEPATVERIKLARRLQALGLTLDEVIDALHSTDRGSPTCASERWRLETVLERIEAQLAELRAVRKEVRSVLAACDAGRCVFAPTAPTAG
jgi:DNA-binding transcriptional MerR regulator